MSRKHSKELLEIKMLVSEDRYYYSSKVRKFIEDGYYQLEDLEQCIFTATRICKIQEDEKGDSTDGRKYTILGRDSQGYQFYTCGKFKTDEDGETYFFITAHGAD